MEEEDYICTLNDEDLRRARNELNEDPRNRLGAVQKLRDWILQQPHIKFPTDTKTLLMYLRYAKFSQLRAQDVIEKLCKLHTEYPNIFKNLDVEEESVFEVLKSGQFVILPGRGEIGQTRVLVCDGMFDVQKTNISAYSKAMVILLLILSHDEETQVCGVDYLIDHSNLTFSHQRFLLRNETSILGKHGSKTCPLRVKSIHIYNTSDMSSAAISMFKVLMSKKMKQRMKLIGSNMEKVYKHFPKECLPKEYLPDDYTGPHAGTKQELIDKFLAEIRKPEFQDYLAYISSDEWGMDLGKKPRRQSLAKSFRRLSVM